MTSFGSWSKHPETGLKSIGIVSCRFVGTAPGILGLASSGLGADLGPKLDEVRPDSSLFSACVTFRHMFYFCRCLADPAIVRDGSGTSFLGPRGRFRAPVRGFLKGFWTPQNNNKYIYIYIYFV